MKTYHFIYSYYPKSGGDDRLGRGDLQANSETEAASAIQRWLKHRSSYGQFKITSLRDAKAFAGG